MSEDRAAYKLASHSYALGKLLSDRIAAVAERTASDDKNILETIHELEKRIEQIEKLQVLDDIRLKNIVDCLREGFGKIEELM